MKLLFTSVLLLLVFCAAVSQESRPDPSYTLWYTTPAKEWEEALPVGNGRLGAMVFGRYGEEKIQLNEETIWSGGPYSSVVKGGAEMLPEIQKDLFEGKPLEAHKLFGRYLMGYPVEHQKYQSAGCLHLFMDNEENVTDYKRWLDLATGTVHTEYRAGEILFRREVFASAPDQVIVVRITSDRPASLNFRAELRGIRNQAHSNYATDYFRMDGKGNNGLMINGKSADYLGVEGRLRYRVQLEAYPEGGDVSVEGAVLSVRNASAVTLYIAAATNFVNYKNVSADEAARAENYLRQVAGKPFERVRDDAVTDYKSLFDRVKLVLPKTGNSYLPTNERISKADMNPDPDLAALCYNFGRYILISSSRKGTEAANLQGIWNEDMNPAWDSKYTTNINLEMNYWAAESGNLAECAEPLKRLVMELTDQGSEVAREHYGAHGWVFHQNTDIWRVAAPMDGPTWGTFTTGGAWLTNELYDHYLYTLDNGYLKEIYPVMKGAVEFFMDFLVEHPNGKWLVTNPSNSPENPPKGPGYKYFFDEVTGSYYFTTITYGSSIDMQILHDLFGYYTDASGILGLDKDFAQRVAKAGNRLVPPLVGSDGSLQEWCEDYGQLEARHRHSSHMYGLYPGNVISVRKTPELIEACKKVLEQRGDDGAGWSRAWKMALWARLYDGDRANRIFKGYIKEQVYPQLFAKCYTPLQIDGSMGVCAAVSEMLVQSHEDVIDLLPALPGEWTEGEFSGVCARGAFELSFGWEKAEVTSVELLSKEGRICRIKAGKINSVTSKGKKVKYKVMTDGSVEFATQKGESYLITQN